MGISTRKQFVAGVDHRIRSYRDMEYRWHLPRTLLGGTPAMQKAGQRYLPREPGESQKAYANRLKRTNLLNGFARTVQSMAGKVFSKPIILKEDVPEQLRDLWEDVDLEGRNGDLFFRGVFEDSLGYGMSHYLVDMPSVPPGLTLKQEKDLNVRPYFVHVPIHNLIGWRAEKIRGVHRLTQIRILDEYLASDGDYGERIEQAVRVITPEKWEIHVADEKGNWVIKDQGQMTLGYIPLVTVYTKRLGFLSSSPPLEDLAYKNLEHWQSTSDQRHILHFARMPLLFGKNLSDLDEGDIEIGPNRLIQGPADSDLKYVEHTGAAINAGRQDLMDLQDQMRLMGLELLMPMQGGGQTATAKSLDYADINSPLQFMAMSLGDSIEQGLKIAADWARLKESGSVKVNTDFGITLRDAADVQSLLQARLAGEISAETFWSELKRRNILSDDFDSEDEKKRLEKEPVPSGRVPGVGDNITGAGNEKPNGNSPPAKAA